jgi:hypothetical protein
MMAGVATSNVQRSTFNVQGQKRAARVSKRVAAARSVVMETITRCLANMNCDERTDFLDGVTEDVRAAWEENEDARTAGPRDKGRGPSGGVGPLAASALGPVPLPLPTRSFP